MITEYRNRAFDCGAAAFLLLHRIALQLGLPALGDIPKVRGKYWCAPDRNTRNRKLDRKLRPIRFDPHQFDPLSAVMCLVVTGIGTLIHVYSYGYMDTEPSAWRRVTSSAVMHTP